VGTDTKLDFAGTPVPFRLVERAHIFRGGVSENRLQGLREGTLEPKRDAIALWRAPFASTSGADSGQKNVHASISRRTIAVQIQNIEVR
jgi:hypothetical protein